MSALLYLEFKKLDRSKPLSLAEKKSLLSAYLKKQSTNPRHKIIKKKIKSLLATASKSQVDLELLFLEAINYFSDVPPTHLEEFFLMVKAIETEFGTTLMLSTPQKVDLNHKPGKPFLCALSEDLNAHFSQNGRLTSQVSFLARLSDYERSILLGVIAKFHRFDIQIDYQDENFIRFSLSAQ